MMAHSLVLHALIAVLSLFLFCVFAKWWVRMYRKAPEKITTIYKINCCLMLGLFLTHSIALSKYCSVIFCQVSVKDTFTWYFGLQEYFIIIPLIGYVAHVIHKIKEKDKDIQE